MAGRTEGDEVKLVKIVDIKTSYYFPNCVVLITTCGKDHPNIRPASMGHKVGDVFTCPYDHKERKP
jgi:hypothetical protein